MKYIKKLNIDFDNWGKLNDPFRLSFNEKYVIKNIDPPYIPFYFLLI